MEQQEQYIVEDENDKSGDLRFLIDAVETSGAGVLTDDEMTSYIQHAQEGMINDEDMDDSHYANIAPLIDIGNLRKLASDVCNWVTFDEETREDWSIRERKGMRLLGVSDETEGGAAFEGASRVVHPLLMEAIVQFQSRAIIELWPKSGPVKTQVLGEATPEVTAQAKRVEDYMNYLYTQEMPGAFEETDQMLFRLPLSGSCFKKCYYDPLEEVLCSRLVEPADFIVPYSAVDLQTAPRFTHRLREPHNEVLKKTVIGFYMDVNLSNPMNEDYEFPIIKEEIDATEGKTRTQIDDDNNHTNYEMYVDLLIEGFDDEDGIARPYIITINRDEQQVLRIQRNWNIGDEKKKKRMYFTHYKFTPGFGFYGYGLLHLIGGLTNSATGALRALLDSAQYENLQGGFKSKDAKIEGGDVPIAPGEWREVQASAEELKQGFVPLPSKGPSQTLFNLLGYLDERAQRLASTTDAMVGDVPANMPVGTALQNQENGSKVFSAIHGRLHEAQAKEFKIIAELNRDWLPDEGYPYLTIGANSTIMASDFDDRVDVIPISDPNLISQAHKIAQGQGVIELAEKFPEEINRRKAVEMMLKSMRVQNLEELMTQTEASEMEQRIAQLEQDAAQADIDKKLAETEKLKAQATSENVTAQYSSLQSAQVAVSMPAVLPVADDLLLSAGYVDANGSPLANAPGIQPQAQIQPELEQNPEMFNTNTSPAMPAVPETPSKGLNQGIETQRADGER